MKSKLFASIERIDRRGHRKRTHRSKEADLVSYKGNRQHMLVIHERKTRYTAAVKLQTKTASEIREALIKFMKCVPKNLRKTITFDNGMEFSQHYRLKEKMGLFTYFCDVYGS